MACVAWEKTLMNEMGPGLVPPLVGGPPWQTKRPAYRTNDDNTISVSLIPVRPPGA